MKSLLFPVYKLSRENTQPENMCDILFKKAKARGGTVKRMSDYGEPDDRKVLYKECYEKIRKIYKKTSVPESVF